MNFYDVLGVSRDADGSDIKGAYRTLAQLYHPDVNEHPDASDQFKVLTKAREVLTDEEERAAYDRLGHRDYVNMRIDGDLPGPDMTPRDEDGTAVDVASVTARGGSSTGGGRAASTGSATTTTTTSGGAASSTGSPSTTRTGGSAGTASGGGSSSGSRAGSRTSTSSDASREQTSGAGAASGGSGSVSASSASHESAVSGRSRGSAGARARGKAHSTPPTPGGSRATGPERISREASQRAARKMGSLEETVRAHFEASNRWLGVVGAALLYFGGVLGYLQANADVVGQLWADLTSSDPQRVAKALGGGEYAIPDLFAFATGGGAGSPAIAGLVGVLGAFVLPVAIGFAVSGLRRYTTWRPSWMHLIGSLGPMASVALGYATGDAAVLPVAHVPLLVHLLLLVGFPVVVVASFLLNRLVVVVPLRRREDLGLP